MWVLRTAAILWAGFAISIIALLIAPGIVSAFIGLGVMCAALLLSVREVFRVERPK